MNVKFHKSQNLKFRTFDLLLPTTRFGHQFDHPRTGKKMQFQKEEKCYGRGHFTS